MSAFISQDAGYFRIISVAVAHSPSPEIEVRYVGTRALSGCGQVCGDAG